MAKEVRKCDDEKGMHDGHRKRLIDLVDRVGLENVTNIQALEYVLCYIFPRGDVNPLAHRLLDRFNDFACVMEASVEDLMAVRGMGETSAKKLHNFLEVLFYYTIEKTNARGTIENIGQFYDYVEQLLRFRTEEELFLFGVDSMGEITKGRRFGKGNQNMVGIDLREISLFLSTHKVKSIILVHNHPSGSCRASETDVISFEILKNKCSFAGCLLHDMVIVGKDGIFSIENKCMQRIFTRILDSQEIFLEDLQKTKK